MTTPDDATGPFVDWKAYVDAMLSERDKAVTNALASAKEAVQVAEVNATTWRANANEWRAAMNDRDKLQPSTQLAIDAVLDELARQFAEGLTAADKDATLALWRRAAISAASRFAP